MSSVLMIFLKTMQSFLPKGMVTFLPVPEGSLSNITSLRKIRIFEIPASVTKLSKAISTAGFTIENVGQGQPVSYSAHTPVGSMTLPDSSNSTVTIL